MHSQKKYGIIIIKKEADCFLENKSEESESCMLSLPRYRIIYPDCLFRGVKSCKNVKPPEDKWAEGAICLTENREFYIINRRQGDGVYGFTQFEWDTLGMCSGLADGEHRDIFEGDILKITRFIPLKTETEEEKKVEDEVFPGYAEDVFMPMFGDEDDDEETPPKEREVFAEPPEGAEVTDCIEGVVYMSGGGFFIQYFDENAGGLSCLPLPGYFGFDGLPLPDTAVKVTGNLYDDEELYAQVLHLQLPHRHHHRAKEKE